MAKGYQQFFRMESKPYWKRSFFSPAQARATSAFNRISAGAKWAICLSGGTAIGRAHFSSVVVAETAAPLQGAQSLRH